MITSKLIKRISRERLLREFSIAYLWPVYRKFIQRHLTKRCVKCALSARLTEIKSDGICAICMSNGIKNIDPITPRIQKELEEKLNARFIEAQGKGKWKYDALVFFSGGKDSSYLLYKLRKEYPKLRLLAITVDNGFMHTVARENIGSIIKKLNVDHMFLRPESELYEKLFHYAFTHMNKKGSALAIDVLDGELRFDMGRHLAANLHIPLIIIGLSRGQILTYSNLLSFEGDQALEELPKTQISMFDIKELPVTENEKSFFWDGTCYHTEDIAHIIFPFFVWNYSEDFLIKELADLNLIPSKKGGPLLTNHLLLEVMGLIDMAQLGYSSWELEFSRMIRTGKARKEYWQYLFEMFEYSFKTGVFMGKSVDELLAQLKLTREELGLPSKK